MPSRAAKNASRASPPSASSPVPKRRGSSKISSRPSSSAKRTRAWRGGAGGSSSSVPVMRRCIIRWTSSSSSQIRYLPRRPSASTRRPATAAASSSPASGRHQRAIAHLQRRQHAPLDVGAPGGGGSSRPRGARASPRALQPPAADRVQLGERHPEAAAHHPVGQLRAHPAAEAAVVEGVVEAEQALRALARHDRVRGRRGGRVGGALRLAAEAEDRARPGDRAQLRRLAPARPRAPPPPACGRRRRRTSPSPRSATPACAPTCPGPSPCASSRARASTGARPRASCASASGPRSCAAPARGRPPAPGRSRYFTDTFAIATTPRARRPFSRSVMVAPRAAITSTRSGRSRLGRSRSMSR